MINLVLTLVTLGIYSAWAKVRKTRYFWQNTRLDGHVFDFHGRPIAILRGRILALVLLLAYSWSFQFSMTAGVVTVCVLCVIAPWLFLKAQQFRLCNTSHRGLRFGFRGHAAGAYFAALPPLLIWFGFVVSLAVFAEAKGAPRDGAFLAVFPLLGVLLMPLLHHRFKAFQHRNATFGDRRFGFDSARWDFYKTYLKGFCVGIAAMFVVFAVAGAVAFAMSRFHFDPVLIGVVSGLLGSLIYVFVWPYMSVRLQQVVWRHSFVDGVRFDTAIRVWPLARLVGKNIGLTLVTAGLYWPFASVAFARYRIVSMRMSMVTPLSWVDAGEDIRARTALGDAASDSFGIDIGL